MRKINFIGGFLVGAIGSIWTLFIFVVGIIIGIVLDIDSHDKRAFDPYQYNSYPRRRK